MDSLTPSKIFFSITKCHPGRRACRSPSLTPAKLPPILPAFEDTLKTWSPSWKPQFCMHSDLIHQPAPWIMIMDVDEQTQKWEMPPKKGFHRPSDAVCLNKDKKNETIRARRIISLKSQNSCCSAWNENCGVICRRSAALHADGRWHCPFTDLSPPSDRSLEVSVLSNVTGPPLTRSNSCTHAS